MLNAAPKAENEEAKRGCVDPVNTNDIEQGHSISQLQAQREENVQLMDDLEFERARSAQLEKRLGKLKTKSPYPNENLSDCELPKGQVNSMNSLESCMDLPEILMRKMCDILQSQVAGSDISINDKRRQHLVLLTQLELQLDQAQILRRAALNDFKIVRQESKF